MSIFPAEFQAQGTLDGRSSSNACTIISDLFVRYFSSCAVMEMYVQVTRCFCAMTREGRVNAFMTHLKRDLSWQLQTTYLLFQASVLKSTCCDYCVRPSTAYKALS